MCLSQKLKPRASDCKHDCERISRKFCARTQLYLLAEVVDLTRAVDQASGEVLGCELVAANQDGVFYKKSIKFVQPGHYGLRFTLIAPINDHLEDYDCGSNNDCNNHHDNDINHGNDASVSEDIAEISDVDTQDRTGSTISDNHLRQYHLRHLHDG